MRSIAVRRPIYARSKHILIGSSSSSPLSIDVKLMDRHEIVINAPLLASMHRCWRAQNINLPTVHNNSLLDKYPAEAIVWGRGEGLGEAEAIPQF